AHACPHCGAAFEDAGACEAHVADHFLATSTEFGCASCMKLFAQPDELQKHLMDMHAHHLFRCALCRDVFDSKVAIQ
ncbi:Zinc finger protein 423 homolog, partial [Gryllus bimaculatus]